MKSKGSGEVLRNAKVRSAMTYKQIGALIGESPEKVRSMCRGIGWTQDLARSVFSATKCPSGLVEVYNLCGWIMPPGIESETLQDSHRDLTEELVASLRRVSAATGRLADNAEKRIGDLRRDKSGR